MVKALFSSTGLVLVGGTLALLTIPLEASAQFGSPTVLAYNALDPNAITHNSQIADFDNDGLKDILALGHPGEAMVSPEDPLEILWYRNLSPGIYADPIAISEPLASEDLLVLDVNGDGLLDVISAFTYLNDEIGLGYLLNMGNDLLSNDPVFLSLPTWTWQMYYVTECFDIDGDLDKDVLVAETACMSGCQFWLVRNNGNGFDPAVSYDMERAVSSMGFFDIDMDNDFDIVFGHTSDDNEIGYSLNDGEGIFSAEVIIGTGTFGIRDIDAGDLDLDGDMDIIAMCSDDNPQITISENNGGLTFLPPVEIFSNTTLIRDMVLSEISGDSYPDILICGGPLPASMHVLENQANGTLTFNYADSISITAHQIIDISTDIPEFILYNGFDIKRIQLPDDSTDWQVRQVNDIPITPNFMDWDGDGNTDLIEWLRVSRDLVWKRNEGNLQFGNAQLITIDAPLSPYRMVPADMDGDGDMDFLIIDNGYSEDIAVMENPGPGNDLGNTLFELHIDEGGPPNAFDYELLDFDLDGDTDLLFGASFTDFEPFGGAKYFRNDGSGALAQVPIPGVPGLIAQRITDLNGDDRSDILYVAENPGRLLWSQNNGASGFGDPTLIGPCEAPDDCILADMDNDGRKDIVYMVYGTPGEVYWMKNTGGASFSDPEVISPISVARLSVVDMDTDGDFDLVLHDAYSIAFVENLGNGIFAQAQTPYLDLEPGNGPAPLNGGLYFHDLDNDGDVEMLYRDDTDLMLAKNYSGTTLEGSVYVDNNGNAVLDSSDVPAPFLHLILAPQGSQPFTNDSGQFMLHADSGAYNLQCQGPWNPALFALNAGQLGYQFTLNGDDHLDSLDFGLVALVDSSLVEPSITVGAAPCGEMVLLWISIKNAGTRMEHGEVQLTLAEGYTFEFSAQVPTSIAGNVITWAFDSLHMFGITEIGATVTRPSVAYMGDNLVTGLSVSTLDSSGVTGVFGATHEEVVACSFDPNAKTVTPSGYGGAHAVDVGQAYLDYTIQFQNLGTAPAQMVTIHDQLSSMLDRTSFELLAYSHVPTKISIDGNGHLKIEFAGIQLPPAGQDYTQSQGFVKFRIGIVPGLPHLSEIHNSASIFFDQNPPVVTDATLTTLVDCSLWSPVASELEPAVIQASDGDAYQWFLNDTILIGDTSQVLMADFIGTYSAVVTSQYGCVAVTNTVDIDSPMKIEEAKEWPVKLVPNPLSLQTRLIFGEVLSSNHRVEVIDPCGKVLQEYHGAGTRELVIQRGGLSGGVYMVQVYAGMVLCGSVRMVVY